MSRATRTMARRRTFEPFRIGISTCLLGEEVRYDGGHKRDSYLVDTLGPFVDWVPVCPEMDIGLGTPREAIRLVRRADRPAEVRLESTKTRVDLTGRMRIYARRQVKALARKRLDGYVFKKDSPSCGMARVRVWSDVGTPARNGRGLFAEALMTALPKLPIEEEGRLSDPRLRENFVDRLFAYRRIRRLFSRRWTVGGLLAFHTAHTLTLMAHSLRAYRELNRLVADAASRDRRALAEEYEAVFMAAVSRVASQRRHADVLNHAAGHFKKQLEGADRRELATLIDEYRRGRIPRIVPLTRARHHARRLGVTYLLEQVYLDPKACELMPRTE